MLDFPKIEVITQDASLPYGNGSPIASAQKFVEGEEAFLILYSDDVVFGEVGDAQVLVESYERNRAVAGIIMAQPISAEVVDKYGIISFRPGTENELQTIIEKPDKGSEPSLLASYGRYLVKPSIFEYLIPNKTGKDGELWTVDAITEVAAAGGKVLVVPTQAEWMTTGDPENYFHAHLQYVQRYEKYGAKLSEWIK